MYDWKLEMGAEVHSSQLYNFIAATLSCHLCCISVAILEKIPIPDILQINTLLQCSVELPKLPVQDAVTPLYGL